MSSTRTSIPYEKKNYNGQRAHLLELKKYAEMNGRPLPKSVQQRAVKLLSNTTTASRKPSNSKTTSASARTSVWGGRYRNKRRRTLKRSRKYK
jgi:hypothetical protein